MTKLRMLNVGSTFYFDDEQDFEWVEPLSKEYQSNSPFPHVVLDNLLPNEFLDAVLSNFPEPDQCSVERKKSHTMHKRGYMPDHLGDNLCRGYLYLFNTAPFIRFLEILTQTNGLIPDPFFKGGGFHEIDRGGKLNVHTDFNLYTRMKLVRHLNVLIYLNKDWPADYGGSLELWDSAAAHRVKSIEPIFNRCVVFDTNKSSFHGHPRPLTCPSDRSRRSIAIYYYVSPVKKIEASSAVNGKTDFVDTNS